MNVDINVYFGPGLASFPKQFGPLLASLTSGELIGTLDAAGVDRAAVSAPGWLGGDFVDPYYEAANGAVADAVREHSDRLIGVGRVNPKLGSRALAVARRCFEEYGFRGLSLDPEVDGFDPLNVEALAPYLALCREYQAPLLMMSGIHPVQPFIYLPLARANQDVPIILLRMGWFVPDDAIILAGMMSNVFLETSGQRALDVRRAIQQVGPERVLVGSGFPFAMPAVEREKVATIGGLSEQDRAAVLGGNASRLFGL